MTIECRKKCNGNKKIMNDKMRYAVHRLCNRALTIEKRELPVGAEKCLTMRVTYYLNRGAGRRPSDRRRSGPLRKIETHEASFSGSEISFNAHLFIYFSLLLHIRFHTRRCADGYTRARARARPSRSSG